MVTLPASAGMVQTVELRDARHWPPELKPEQEALGLLRFLRAKRLGKDELIDRMRVFA